MGRKKEVYLYNNRYKGKNLTDRDCDRLDFIRDCYEQGKFFADLKHYLYDLTQDEVDAIKDFGSGDAVPNPPQGELSDSQTISVAFGITAKCWLSGDSVGLGKTPVAAGIFNYLTQQRGEEDRPRMLFLTDKEDVMYQNRDQLIRFTGQYFQATTGKKQSASKLIEYYMNADTLPNVIGTHSLIRQPLFQELITNYREETGKNPFDMVVIDESAVLGNQKTILYKNAESLFSDVEYRVCLNGTEFDTKLLEFYNQLNWLDPTFMPTKTAFQKEYCEMGWSQFGGYMQPTGKYKNADDFKKKVGYRYFARTRRDLGAVMEDCSAEIIEVPISNYQKHLLKDTSMPNMALNCPWEIDRSASISYDTCPKLKALLEVLDTRLGYDVDAVPPQVLVYCHHKAAQRGIVELLNAADISNRVLNGDTPSDDRQEIISEFKNGDFQILVTNVQKGLNFGQIDHIVFYEFPSVGQAIQFEGRATRQENIIGKHVYVLLYNQKELERFQTILADRGKALNAFANTDYSMILTLLLKEAQTV